MVCASKQLLLVCHEVVTHRHTWATHHFQALKTEQREVGGREGGVQAAGGGRHYSGFHLSLVHPTSHGEEGGWELAPLRRFPAALSGYGARCLPTAQHAGFRP